MFSCANAAGDPAGEVSQKQNYLLCELASSSHRDSLKTIMNQASQDRLKLVYPRFADKIYKLSTLMAAEDLHITVAQGLRTVDEQDELYAKGRDSEGNVVDKAKVVTNARGGNSWHNFGLAVDCYPADQAGGVDWNPQHPDWKRMEALGVSLGLTSGANWIRIVDAPHFQLTGRFPVGAPTDEVRELYKTGGLLAVWAAVEASLPAEAEGARA
jgi:D-alanyl-D-alanine carboxypeptidase